MTPAIKTDVSNASKEPNANMAETMIAVNPAAGPDTLICEFEIAPMMMPPITPDIIPENKGAPDAIAIPKQRGSATKNTTKPDEISYFRLDKRLLFFII